MRDHNGQALAYIYFEPGRRSAAKLLTHDEARRKALAILQLRHISRMSRWASSGISVQKKGSDNLGGRWSGR
jgi:hypothetical protein